jgi:protease PrsW
MDTSTLIAYLQAPLFAVLLILYLKVKFGIKNWKQIVKALVFGFLAVTILFLFDVIAESTGYDQLKNLKRSAFFAFVIVGFGSELGKFVLLRYVFLRLKTFRGPLDGVIYSLFISLGFTILALPLFGLGVFAKEVDTLFLFTYPLANICFAVIMGFFVGMGKHRKNRLIDSLTGLGSASFFHGFYYFANLTSDRTILLLFGIGLFLIAFLLGVKSINVKEGDSGSGSRG